MNKNLLTIEDCLETLTGLSSNDKFEIDSNDKTIINSIARQVFKGTALTDRQFLLMKEKLSSYFEQFLSNNYTGHENAIHELRQPLREIDRSKFIKIVEFDSEIFESKPHESHKAKWTWIVIRFPFSKKSIVKLEKIVWKFRKYYAHKKGSHKHFFKLSENILYELVTTFKNQEFVIDETLLEMYNQIVDIKNNPKEYVPGLWNNNIENISESGKQYIGEKLQTLNSLQLYDRRRMYGINYITHDIDDTLANDIAHRTDFEAYIDNTKYSLSDVIDSVVLLKRFPMLVLLDNGHEYEQLERIHKETKQIPNSQQTVLFRTENKTANDKQFNNYIHKNLLNNWLDEKIKILYLSKQKLPKVLFSIDWKPMSVFCLTSTRMNTIVSNYIDDTCDLHVYYEKEKSVFWRSKSAYM